MTAHPVLLGIDEGTSAVKAALFGLDGAPLRSARRHKPLRHAPGGVVEQDPLAILDAIVGAVAEVLGAAAEVEVAACGLDHQGESVLAWDGATGAPLTPVLTWQDGRAVLPDGDAVLREAAPDGAPLDARAALERSSLPRSPYFSAGKLAWLLREEPSLRRAGVRLGTVESFVRDRLGAGHATDPSTASRTQLVAIDAPTRWDPALLEAFGVDARALPAIRPTLGDLGTLRHEAWPGGLPLRASCADQQAALAGAGCVEQGAIKATYGTGVFVLAHAGVAAPRVEGLLPTVAWQHGDEPVEYALDGGVFTAGALLDWLARDLGLATDAQALVALADGVADAGGVRVLPALAGLGAPFFDEAARGVVAGLHGGVGAGHVARAALDAIAHRVADVVEALPRPPEVLRVDGGLTRSDLLLQRQADLLGLPVARTTIDATAFGAAALAAVGAGLWPSTASIAGRVTLGERFEPRLDAHERLRERAAWTAFLAAARTLR